MKEVRDILGFPKGSFYANMLLASQLNCERNRVEIQGQFNIFNIAAKHLEYAPIPIFT